MYRTVEKQRKMSIEQLRNKHCKELLMNKGCWMVYRISENKGRYSISVLRKWTKKLREGKVYRSYAQLLVETHKICKTAEEKKKCY